MKSDYFNLIESKLNGKKKKLVKYKHKKTGGVRTSSPSTVLDPLLDPLSTYRGPSSTPRVSSLPPAVLPQSSTAPLHLAAFSSAPPAVRPKSPTASLPLAPPSSPPPLSSSPPPSSFSSRPPLSSSPPIPSSAALPQPPTAPSVRPSLHESAKKKSTKKVKFDKNMLKIGESAKNAYKNVKKSFKNIPSRYSEIKSNISRIISNNSETTSNDIQSPSYPYKLQVIPRHRNTEKKTSEAFDLHLDKIQQKIQDTSEKIDNQSKYVAEKQRILDKEKENLDDWFVTSSSQRKERIWNIIKFSVITFITNVWKFVSIVVSIVKWIIDRIMSIIRWALLIFVKILIALQPILWAIMAIICVFILILLIAWLIRGGRFELGINNNGKNSDIDIDLQIKSDDSLKVSSSKNYGSSVTIPPWNWNNFIMNPINYTINYTLATTLNKVNNYIDIPEVLNKVRIQNPIYTLRKNFKLLNNDNLKIDRIQNDKQREDNISFINYKLIDENIANEYCQVKEKQNKYHSISLIKPKNIEWELPHLDYTNTDMSKLPESIKNYKNSNNANSLSLNEQSKIIFPWQYNNDKWTLDCKTKFINNEFTGLYEDNGDGNCKATLQPATKHPP